MFTGIPPHSSGETQTVIHECMEISLGCINIITHFGRQPWIARAQIQKKLAEAVVLYFTVLDFSLLRACRVTCCQHSLPRSVVVLNTDQRHVSSFEGDGSLTVSCHIQQRHSAHMAYSTDKKLSDGEKLDPSRETPRQARKTVSRNPDL